MNKSDDEAYIIAFIHLQASGCQYSSWKRERLGHARCLRTVDSESPLFSSLGKTFKHDFNRLSLQECRQS